MVMRADWAESRLADLCTRVTVGHVGRMRDEYREDGVPFLRSQNVQPFRADTRDVKFVDETFHRKLKTSALTAGDVVVVRTGYPGTAALVPDALPVANCADLVIITPGSDLDGRFLGNPRSAVHPVNCAIPLEDPQVASNGGERGADRAGQRLNRRKSIRVEMTANSVEPVRSKPASLSHRTRPVSACADYAPSLPPVRSVSIRIVIENDRLS